MIPVTKSDSESDRNPDSTEKAELESRVSDETRGSPEPEKRGVDCRVSGSCGSMESNESENGRPKKVRFFSSEDTRPCSQGDRGIDKATEFGVFEFKDEDAISRASVDGVGCQNDRFDAWNDRTDLTVSGSDGHNASPKEKVKRFDAWNEQKEHVVSKSDRHRLSPRARTSSQNIRLAARNDQTQRIKSEGEQHAAVSQYNYVANGTLGTGMSKGLGHGFELGDMVWGKVKSHPWWPGLIFNEVFANSSVRRTKRAGHVLVAFFGDSSYGWFDPAELIPFDPNYAEKSRQTSSRNLTKAVDEAVDEASRRRALGLTCRCRNPYNFRATNVQGYYSVDVADYEAGGVYSANQIKKARDSFQPSEILNFIKQLAVTPHGRDEKCLDLIKNKATVFAYRKAVYEEFDETYAQAFGCPPVRPSHEKKPVLDEPVKVPARALLSGPLVIAEALGSSGKSSKKPVKVKDQLKKDKYLFKRRDEAAKVSTTLQISETQPSSSPTPAYVEGGLTLSAGDFVFQKRDPPVSTVPQVSLKQETAVVTPSDQSEVTLTLDKESVVSSSLDQSEANVDTHSSIDASPPLDKGGVEEAKDESGVGSTSMEGIDLPAVSNNSQHEDEPMVDIKLEVSAEMSKSADPNFPMTVEVYHNQVHGGPSVEHRKMGNVGGVKKVKELKRPRGDSSFEKSNLEKKRKKKKDIETSSENLQKSLVTGKVATPVGKVVGKSIQTGVAPRVDSQVEHQKKDGSTSSVFDSVGVSLENAEPELVRLVIDLQALALDPFHGIERNSPSNIRQFFLKFRSLVFQKSLLLSPPRETEFVEVRSNKSPAGENIEPVDKDALPPTIVKRPVGRPADPTKAGRKRSPSDRQEENAAKRVKKINDLKSLSAEKKANLKTPPPESVKNTAAVAAQPPVKLVRKSEPHPSRGADDPAMLIMKFPPHTSLPSVAELKARFARFGALDHGMARVNWKNLTCQVVFRRKGDAQTAYNHAVGNTSFFNNVNVQYQYREMGAPSRQNIPRVEDDISTSIQTPSLVAPQMEQRRVPHQQQQLPASQLKSILKKSTGEEVVVGQVTPKGTPRVKFMLVGDHETISNKGEQLFVGANGKNYNNNSTSFADAAATSINSNNFQKVIPIPPPPLPAVVSFTPQFTKPPPPPQPNLPPPLLQTNLLPPPQQQKLHSPPPQQNMPPPPPPPQQNLHYKEMVAPRNYNAPSQMALAPPLPPLPPPVASVDIAHPLLSLLTRCNDVVDNVKTYLGYVPYHPL